MSMTGREMIEAARRVVPGLNRPTSAPNWMRGERVVVLDVRERAEWDDGHIPQATWLRGGSSRAAWRKPSPTRTRPS